MFNKLKKISLCACLALCTSLTHASSLNTDDDQQQGGLSQSRLEYIFRSSQYDMREELRKQENVEKKISRLERHTNCDEANKLYQEEKQRKELFQKEKKENFQNVLKNMQEQKVKDIADFFHYTLSDIEFEAEKKLKEQRKELAHMGRFLDIHLKSNQVLTEKLLKMGLDLGEPGLLESVLYLPECCGFSAGEVTHRWTEAGKKFEPMNSDSDSDSDANDNDYMNHNNNNDNNNNNNNNNDDDEQSACAMSAMIPQEDPLKNRVCFAFLGNVLKPGMTFELTYTTNGDPLNEGPVNFYLGGNFFKQIEPTFKEENVENFHLSFQIPENMFQHRLMTVGFDVPSSQKPDNGDQRMIGFALKTLKIS